MKLYVFLLVCTTSEYTMLVFMLFLKCEKYEIMPIKYTDVEVKWDRQLLKLPLLLLLTLLFAVCFFFFFFICFVHWIYNKCEINFVRKMRIGTTIKSTLNYWCDDRYDYLKSLLIRFAVSRYSILSLAHSLALCCYFHNFLFYLIV